jgi:Rho-binding antiterminator
MTDDYTPIACAFHDRLEDAAVRQRPVRLVWRDPQGERTAETTVADVFAKEGADWVRLGTGETVRADRLVSLDGHALGGTC